MASQGAGYRLLYQRTDVGRRPDDVRITLLRAWRTRRKASRLEAEAFRKMRKMRNELGADVEVVRASFEGAPTLDGAVRIALEEAVGLLTHAADLVRQAGLSATQWDEYNNVCDNLAYLYVVLDRPRLALDALRDSHRAPGLHRPWHHPMLIALLVTVEEKPGEAARLLSARRAVADAAERALLSEVESMLAERRQSGRLG